MRDLIKTCGAILLPYTACKVRRIVCGGGGAVGGGGIGNKPGSVCDARSVFCGVYVPCSVSRLGQLIAIVIPMQISIKYHEARAGKSGRAKPRESQYGTDNLRKPRKTTKNLGTRNDQVKRI